MHIVIDSIIYYVEYNDCQLNINIAFKNLDNYTQENSRSPSASDNVLNSVA